jgi:hypothetical protein
LKITSRQELTEFLREFKEEQTELRKQILNICWHLRGGISREEAWTLSVLERNDIMKFINERIKIVQETKLPLL